LSVGNPATRADRPGRDAFELALATIQRRERSAAEVSDWLEGRGYDRDQADDAVSRLIEVGALDDERFARAFAEDKRTISGWGSERIGAVLRERGIDPQLIDRACAEDRRDEVERAAGLLIDRGAPVADDRDRGRALGFLVRRGYEYEIAYDAVRNVERADAA
jgi:regulatory protein